MNIIKLILGLYKEFLSYQTVAQKLNDNNIKKRNVEWTRYSVCSIVKKYHKIKMQTDQVLNSFSDLKL